MTMDWDWSGELESDALVVRPVNAIAVYSNDSADLVIRQRGAYPEPDSVVVVPKAYANALLAALQKEIAE